MSYDFLIWEDEVLPIVTRLNSDGDETENDDETVVIVAGPMSDGQWLTTEVFPEDRIPEKRN